MDPPIFLISLNEETPGHYVNFTIQHDRWQHILRTARAKGWQPQGTILDYEFQYRLATFRYEDLDQEGRTVIERQVRDNCRNWQGGYLTPKYQIVTDEDVKNLRAALQTEYVSFDLLMFLSHGTFRIGR